MVVGEFLRPGWKGAGHPLDHAGADVEFDPVALAVVEADRLDVRKPVERPGQAGGRILAAREQDQGVIASRFGGHRMPRSLWVCRPSRHCGWPRQYLIA